VRLVSISSNFLFFHVMYLDLNSELRQFERQYRNISVRFVIDLVFFGAAF